MAEAYGDAVDAVEGARIALAWIAGEDRGRKRAPLRHEFHAEPGRAAERAEELRDGADVYVGVCPVVPPASGRGGVEDVAAVVGVWADVDVQGPHHRGPRGKSYPPTFEDAERVVDRVGPAPSLLVNSGGGLQAYWWFAEPWILDSQGERDEAARLARRWVDTVRACAAAAGGWDLDPVGDLARVLRVPGTFNHKGGDPLRVRVVRPTSGDVRRYEPGDLEQYLVAEEFAPDRQSATYRVEALELRPNAQPPAGKLGALIANDDKFRATWERKRPDLRDQSGSAFDLALANFAVGAGWTDQEIGDLIVAHRREHDDQPEKGLRRDYVQRTIAKARADRQSAEALEDLSQDSGPDAATPEAEAGERERRVDQLRHILRIPIARWIQRSTEPGEETYSLVLADGRSIPIGSAEVVCSQTKFRQRVYAATGAYLTVPKNRWADVCKALASIREVEELEESGRRGKARGWLDAYLPDVAIHRDEDWADAMRHSEPFVEEGHIHVNVEHLQRFLRQTQGKSIPDRVIWDAMRELGFERVQRTARVLVGRKSSRPIFRRYWRAPLSAVGMGDTELEAAEARRRAERDEGDAGEGTVGRVGQ